MNDFASSIATRQKNESIIRCCKSFDSTIFVYNTSIPARHKAGIRCFLDLVVRSVGDIELDRCLRNFISQRCLLLVTRTPSALLGLSAIVVQHEYADHGTEIKVLTVCIKSDYELSASFRKARAARQAEVPAPAPAGSSPAPAATPAAP